MNYHYMHINYLLNKYKRKFKVMKTKYYDLKRNYGNYDLFIIKRGGRKKTVKEILLKVLLK